MTRRRITGHPDRGQLFVMTSDGGTYREPALDEYRPPVLDDRRVLCPDCGPVDHTGVDDEEHCPCMGAGCSCLCHDHD